MRPRLRADIMQFKPDAYNQSRIALGLTWAEGRVDATSRFVLNNLSSGEASTQ